MNVREKKKTDKKKVNSTLQHLRSDFRGIMDEEDLNGLSFLYIHRDIFLNYDKIIDIFASKYLRKMLLINPLRED